MYTFDEITGNEFIVKGVTKAISENRTAHAYIFDGREGTGKKLLAGTFAKTLQCEKGGTKPCGECISCRAFDDSNHPDVIYIKPEGKSLGVDDIRERINALVKVKPYKYKYKVFIVDGADAMTVPAQNALLKSIEEPPGYVKFFLLSKNYSAFLPTILSRCIMYKILPLKYDDIYGYLTQKGYTGPLVKTACSLSEGSIGKALNIIDDENYLNLRDEIENIILKFDKYTAADISLLTAELEKYKDKPEDFLDIMYLWYRDALVYKSTLSKNYIMGQDKAENIAIACGKLSLSAILNGIDAVAGAKDALKHNANFRLCMDVMLMKIAGA